MNINIEHYSHYRANRQSYPVLPDNMQREDLFKLIKKIGRSLGIGDAALRTFELMGEHTRPSAFKELDCEPVCYVSQKDLAKERGVDPSRVRAHELELERAGLIERRTMANGARAGFAGCGIYFSRAIHRASEFILLANAQEADRKEHRRLCARRSTHLRHIKSILGELSERLGDNKKVTELKEAFSAWPTSAALHRLSLDELYQHESEADKLCQRALALLDFTEKSHGRAPENTASYIQDTTQDSIPVNCSDAPKRHAGKPAYSDNLDPPPNGDGCKEKDYEVEREAHKNEYVSKLSPCRIHSLCGDHMKLYLGLRNADPDQLTPHDFAIAAQDRRHDLGIHKSAWIDAVSELGEAAATMCVIILDRRHEQGLVRSPGGYLRAMTTRQREGRLDIIGGLIGLSMLHSEGTVH